MYKVIGSAKTRAFRVLWTLEELGQPYEHLPAPPRSPDVRVLNPQGKVPVLEIDGTPITDSTAIMTFLSDRHQALTYPAGSLDRARQDSLTQFLLDEFDAVLWTAARHSFILPQEQRVDTIKGTLRWEFARSQKVLAQRMSSGPFLMGDKLTIADILLTHCCNWAAVAKFPIEEPQLHDYLDAIRQRPAYARALAA